MLLYENSINYHRKAQIVESVHLPPAFPLFRIEFIELFKPQAPRGAGDRTNINPKCDQLLPNKFANVFEN